MLELVRALAEILPLRILLVERAQHTHARKVAAKRADHAVQTTLHATVERDRDQHDREDDNGEHGDQTDEHKRRAVVDRVRHDGGAEDDERRAHQQTERQVDAVLNLVHITRKARDKRVRADGIDFRVGECSEMFEECAADPAGVGNRHLGRKILRRHGEGKSRDTEEDHQKNAAHDVAAVALRDADIDDGGNDQRNEKLHDRLKEFEHGRGHGAKPVAVHIAE